MEGPEEWLYLDRSGREFGPFPSQKMRAWFAQEHFPIGRKLLVRAPSWMRHVPVHDLFPEAEPFSCPPRPPAAEAPLALPALPPPGYPPPGYGAAPGYAPPGCAPGYPPPGAYGAFAYGAPGAYPPPPAFAYPPPAYGPCGRPPAWPPGRGASRSRSPRGGRGGRRRRPGEEPRRFRPHHTAAVPRATDLGAKFAPGGGPASTAMLRNIPNKYTQEQLLEEIDERGFRETYDFFYLPIDVKNSANVGYAFINFLQAPDFERFCEDFQHYRFRHSGSKKIAAVSPAVVQGLRSNVENLLRKRVAQGRHGPVLVREGRRVGLEEMAAALELS